MFTINKWKKWDFWKSVRDFAEKKMKEAWFIGGNCNSCCPNCKNWESTGKTVITSTDNDDESISRKCSNCGHTWRAIFTPAGFVPIDEEQE